MAKKEKILLTVTGLTPQVVTETLFALYQSCDLPDRIVLVTTEHGKNRAVRDLLDPVDGKFFAFCRDFNCLGQIKFAAEDIRVISGPKGEPLTDIRTPQDNEYAADFIMRTVQALCENDHTEIHLSIAGGRKSMGFLAGYALSIFGRDCDHMSHVLVSEPFENNRDFFYPTPQSTTIFAPDGSPLDPHKAEVSLADIPFIRLRSGITDDLLNGCSTFADAVKIAQKTFAPQLSLVIDVKNFDIHCASKSVHLTPTRFMAYLWYARRAKDGLGPTAANTTEDWISFIETVKAVLGNNSKEAEQICRTVRKIEDLRPFLQEQNSRINQLIKKNLGSLSKPYLVVSTGKRPVMQYQIMLDKGVIQIKNVN